MAYLSAESSQKQGLSAVCCIVWKGLMHYFKMRQRGAQTKRWSSSWEPLQRQQLSATRDVEMSIKDSTLLISTRRRWRYGLFKSPPAMFANFVAAAPRMAMEWKQISFLPLLLEAEFLCNMLQRSLAFPNMAAVCLDSYSKILSGT